MEDKTKNQIVLEGLQGEPITFTLKTTVSAFDEEQVNNILYQYMEYDNDKKEAKFVGNSKMAEIGKARQDKLIELFVTAWNGADGELNPTNIKKALSTSEFAKLVDAVNGIFDRSGLSTEKKSPSPESSLSA